MKSNICFLLTSLLLIINTTDILAGGPVTYYPYGYKMYRVYDAKAAKQPDQITENCRMWQKLTSSEIPLSDIKQVVYKYTLDQMNSLMSVNSTNAFASWIKDTNDTEIYDFLILAKICEKTRGEMLDPWYYPSQNDGLHLTLSEIEQEAKAYDGKRLKDRYVLQAVRAMFSAQKYQEITEYWCQVEPLLPRGVIKEMISGYVLGAYARVDNIDEAMDYFIKAGDLNSIIYCLSHKGEITDIISKLECINKYAPYSHQIPEILQDLIGGIEPWGRKDRSYTYRRDTSLVYGYDKELLEDLYSLASKMIKNPSSDKALWHYTAAFLADLDAKPDQGWIHIQQASQYPASEYLKESIRVMRMYMDAKVSPYDAAYESRLYSDLQWLDGKIRSDMTEHVRGIVGDWDYYMVRNNMSLYYWNDMLRRILLAEICPRMLDRGMDVRALQLANMADNRIFMLCDIVNGKSMNEHRSASSEFNWLDYSSDFFKMMQEVSPTELYDYIKTSQSKKSAFEIFLNDRGYTNPDYLYDVLGTMYIRNADYKNAVKYLSKVSEDYQSRLNTEQYMGRDPFSIERKYIEVQPGYKLNFAREMQNLEESIAKAKDNSIKAMDMIRYATGLNNSYRFCWALTRYSHSWEYHDGNGNPFGDLNKKISDMYNEALSIVENEELAAIAHIKLCQWKTAVSKYPQSYASEYAKVSCDNLCDYSMNWVLTRKNSIFE